MFIRLLFQEREKQTFLAAKMRIKGSAGVARLLGDVFEARRFEAVSCKYLARRKQQAPTRFFGLLLMLIALTMDPPGESDHQTRHTWSIAAVFSDTSRHFHSHYIHTSINTDT